MNHHWRRLVPSLPGIVFTLSSLIAVAPASARCLDPTPSVFLAGVEDNFLSGNEELAVPGPALANYFATNGSLTKNFDDARTNFFLGHTFRNLPTGICGASLRISICAGTGSNSQNDSLLLELSGSSFAWNQRFSTLSGLPWSPGDCRELTLDLANLPAGLGFSKNDLIPSLADGELEVVVQDDSTVDFVELTVQHCRPVSCAAPPRDLKAWWPLDETTGATANELAQHADGTWNFNVLPVPGKVAGALSFDGQNSHVTVPNQPAVDFGGGDFTIDFWMRSNQSAGIVSLLEKRELVPQAKGWTVFLNSGRLAFQMAEGGSSDCNSTTPTGCTNFDSGAMVADGSWKFITITADRDNPQGLLFYVNGQLVSTQNPTLRQDSLANSGPLFFGRHADPLIQASLNGALDEVELFDRALARIEFLTILDAGGKCKSRLEGQWDVALCQNESVLHARPRLCNLATADTSFGLHFSPLPTGDYPNGFCSIDGPTQFHLAESQPVLVPAGACVDLHLDVTKPAGMRPRQTACFEVEAEDLTSGQVSTSQSSFYDNGAICCFPQNGSSTGLPAGRQAPTTFDVLNFGNAERTFNYQLESMSSDGLPSALTLDGGRAGDVLTGQVVVPAAGRSQIRVDVGLDGFLPFARQDLLLRDRDADAVLSSRGFSSFVPGCTPNATTLCLNQGRFETKVIWRDFIGQEGSGFGHHLTGDSGYFWFFSPDNVEVVVKVLDGRPINDNWWVFFGALSTVEYTVVVRDTFTGESKSYSNPPGALASVGDIEALPGYEPRAGSSSAALPETSTLGEHGGSPKESGPQPAGACVPSGTVLCLQEGRFQARVSWSTPAGSTGAGLSASITTETGYFWFFSPNNVELVVKVLDGGNINGKWWVFYGALSDVQYTLTVTDTLTGVEKVYHNQSGRFASGADLEAFDE